MRLLFYLSLIFLAAEVTCVCCFVSISNSSLIRDLRSLSLVFFSLSITTLSTFRRVDLPLDRANLVTAYVVRLGLAFFAVFRAFRPVTRFPSTLILAIVIIAG